MKKGQKWYNNGIIDKGFFLNEVPDGFVEGRLYQPTAITKEKIRKANIGNQNHLKDGKHLRNFRIAAWKYFWPEGNGKRKPGFDLHHTDITLKYQDFERYQHWNIEDLVMIPHSEHMSIHAKLKHKNGILKVPSFKNHHHNEEVKEKISIASKSRKHYGNPNIMKKVQCIETQEIFNSITEAALKYKCQHINDVCNGTRKTAGKLHWKWV